ncbi:hypothetical protein [Hydrogenivirga sp.]
MAGVFLCVVAGVLWWVGISFVLRSMGLEPTSRDPEVMGRVFGVVVSMLSLFGYETEKFCRNVGIKGMSIRLALLYVVGVVGGLISALFYPLHPEGFRDLLLGSLSVKASFLMGFSEGAITYAFFLLALNILLNFLRLLR